MSWDAAVEDLFRAVLGALCLTLAGMASSAPVMKAQVAADGQVDIQENGKPVLRYNYRTVEPGERLKEIAQANLIYARARSDYIHPLYGFHGEELTKDLPVDHPHHRGIYWAWPETKYGEEMGDLHALQRVFARPTGRIRVRSGADYAEIVAENQWMWDDKEPIVHETATIRAYRSGRAGRFVDLVFRIKALKPGVSLARRGTNAYGGLNMRMNAVQNQEIVFHTDPPQSASRRAWAYLAGTFAGGSEPTAVVVMQHPGNPDYPGDWVKFPELNWYQPTFPAANTRYSLEPGKPLVLRYRLWIRPGGAPAESACNAAWEDFASNRAPRAVVP